LELSIYMNRSHDDASLLTRDQPALWLTPTSASALEACFNARAESSPSAEAHGHPLNPAGRLLALLDAPVPTHDPSLVDATIARLLRAREAQGPVLSILDDEALDAWMLRGQEVESVPASLRARAQSIETIGQALRETPSFHDSTRADRVLAAIQRAQDQREQRFREPALAASRGSSWRVRELVSIAAMLLLGVAVVLPMMSALRSRTMQTACLSNLHAVGQGVSSYAISNRNSMPMLTAGFSGEPWWDVGVPERSNSANLFTLVTNRYVRLADMACPGNPFAPRAEPTPEARDWQNLQEVSYSYQIIPKGASLDLAGSDRVLLADRSPIVMAAVQHRWVDPEANSPNHRSNGQHLLQADGSVIWLEAPVLETGDNIWLPRPIERQLDELRRRHGQPSLNGMEVPESADDVFLGP
jgi:hypothetical protein